MVHISEIGESVVGSYLKIFESCDIIEYNLIISKEIDKFGEIDVVGVKISEKKAFLCEVVTHLQTMNYGSRAETTKKIKQKLLRNIKTAEVIFPNRNISHMVWSPIVGKSQEDDLLETISDIKQKNNISFVFNEDYSSKVLQLLEKAIADTRDYKEPFFRSLQILTHLKLPKNELLFNKSIFDFKPSKRVGSIKLSKSMIENMIKVGADPENIKKLQ